ncbi:YesL family protein [Bacillus horti]|uniref:Membrane protein YesL n=1 Tax=Caldalkalibacillus horti TaxID=77523 RepID=A0ABT9W589_9BACI|nr:YesL family protein [Bacillus horti]MDQ0168411.1 putative membrane protein YesL [Bacillus horti]
MDGSGLSGRLYRLCEWIMRLAFLNLIWILFTLMGLVAFTIFPATAALFGITRKWVRGEEDFPIFQTYKALFRQEFWSAQALGYAFLLAGVVLYVDYLIFSTGTTTLFIALKYVTVLLIFFYLSICLFVFPVLVHYDMKLMQSFKTAFFLGVLHPGQSIFMLASLGLLGFVMFRFAGLLPFFGLSVGALWITIITHKVFEKVALKYKVNES